MFNRLRDYPQGAAAAPEWPVDTGFAQWQGTRDEQNDVGYISRNDPGKGLLLALADGLGINADAGTAAAVAVNAVKSDFERKAPTPEPHQQILRMLGAAHSAVRAFNESLTAKGEMAAGATLACALLRDGRLSFGSIGNVRLFLMRGGAMIQLNREHLLNLEAEERDILAGGAPDIDPEWAMRVTSYAGMDGLRQLDWQQTPIPLIPGDRVLLMSSGLYGVLPEGELAALLARAESAQAAANQIIGRIRAASPVSQSNISLAILQVGAPYR